MSAMHTHEEWAKEHSLSAPADRDRAVAWKPEQFEAALTPAETESAYKELNNTAFTSKFPRVDRTYADPPVQLQSIGLISFTPAKGAVANKDGVFGFAKLRGNYASEMEANQRAEYLIRNVDSYHQIYHTYVGRPFPITASSQYSADTQEIDIRRAAAESISSAVKEKKMEEKRTVDDIKQREEALRADTQADPEEKDPIEEYTTLRVKKAQLIFTYLEHQRLMKEVKASLIKTRSRVEHMDETDPTLKDRYYKKYMDARDTAGLVQSDADTQSNFIKYMVEDVDLGF